MQYLIGLLLACCCLYDYSCRKIPNYLIALLGGCILLHIFSEGDMWTMAAFLGGSALTVAAAWPLYAIGTIGAGDVKLVAVMCGFAGDGLLLFLFVTFAAAAAVSLGKMCFYGNARKRFSALVQFAAECALAGRLLPYSEELRERRTTVCMAGPVLLGYLIMMKGVFI